VTWAVAAGDGVGALRIVHMPGGQAPTTHVHSTTVGVLWEAVWHTTNSLMLSIGL
jgi:hypothetical protein